MADTTPQPPYQFGDIVDGYRWTITGWEPLSPPERTVGVPRLLEARYAATQAARQKDGAGVAEQRSATVIAAPDLTIEFDDPPAEGDDPFASALAHGSRVLALQHEPSEIEIAVGKAAGPRPDRPRESTLATPPQGWYPGSV